MTNMRHFEALLATAGQVGWPLHFRADLTEHDRAQLATMPVEMPFIWILRPCGTHIYYPGPVGRYHRASDMARIQASTFGRENCRFFIWNGESLNEYPSPLSADDCMRQYETDLNV